MKFLIYIVVILVLVLMLPVELEAQCAMCRAVVESSMENDGVELSQGINTGILYLMGFPYMLIMGFLAYVFKDDLSRMVKDMF